MSVLVTFDACGETIGPRVVSSSMVTSFAPSVSTMSPLETSQVVNVIAHASRLDVRFAKETVSPVALTGLLMWLYLQHQRPMAVVGARNKDVIEILPDRQSAVSFLSDLIAARSSQMRFERRDADLEQTRFSDVWRAAKEICTADIAEHVRLRILDQLFGGSYTLGEFDERDGACRMAAVGSVVRQVDPHFAASGEGVAYNTMADRDYGAWLAETFKTYRDRDRPFAERIGAVVNYSAFPSKLQFTRLVVPYRIGGRQRVLVASDVQSVAIN